MLKTKVLYSVEKRKRNMSVNNVDVSLMNETVTSPLHFIIIIIIMSVMQLGYLMTRSGLTYLEVSSEVCNDSFCQLGNSVSLSWVVCRETFCLHAVSSSSCISVVYLEPVLFLIPSSNFNF